MDPDTSELIDLLDRIISILDTFEETHWSSMLRKSKLRIEASDYSGVEILLGSYGGMGSFNDLMIQPSRECSVVTFSAAEVKANGELNSLRSLAWKLAKDIKHEQ
jgi:hypothetical protein